MAAVSTTADERRSLSFIPSPPPCPALTLGSRRARPHRFRGKPSPLARGIVTEGQDGGAGLASGVRPRVEPERTHVRTRSTTPRLPADRSFVDVAAPDGARA